MRTAFVHLPLQGEQQIIKTHVKMMHMITQILNAFQAVMDFPVFAMVSVL